MTDIVLDAHGLTTWASRRPSRHVVRELEACQRSRGVVVVPTVAVVEGTSGDPRRDASVNRRLKSADVESLSLELAREAARLRVRHARQASAADATVAATALRRGSAVLVTSDPRDLTALCTGSRVRVVAV